jgi:hypothetical protein
MFLFDGGYSFTVGGVGEEVPTFPSGRHHSRIAMQFLVLQSFLHRASNVSNQTSLSLQQKEGHSRS